jgi:hypothetical protein
LPPFQYDLIIAPFNPSQLLSPKYKKKITKTHKKYIKQKQTKKSIPNQKYMFSASQRINQKRKTSINKKTCRAKLTFDFLKRIEGISLVDVKVLSS